MVKISIPRYEVVVDWVAKENAECPLNDIWCRGKQAQVYFFKESYHPDIGECIPDEYAEETVKDMVEMYPGPACAIYMNPKDMWDLEMTADRIHPLFVGFLGFPSLLMTAPFNDIMDTVEKAFYDYKQWGHGRILGADLYRITHENTREKLVGSKIGWYADDVEDMICYLINDAWESIPEDAFVGITLPEGLGVE